jgi:hypothetical protein
MPVSFVSAAQSWIIAIVDVNAGLAVNDRHALDARSDGGWQSDAVGGCGSNRAATYMQVAQRETPGPPDEAA